MVGGDALGVGAVGGLALTARDTDKIPIVRNGHHDRPCTPNTPTPHARGARMCGVLLWPALPFSLAFRIEGEEEATGNELAAHVVVDLVGRGVLGEAAAARRGGEARSRDRNALGGCHAIIDGGGMGQTGKPGFVKLYVLVRRQDRLALLLAGVLTRHNGRRGLTWRCECRRLTWRSIRRRRDDIAVTAVHVIASKAKKCDRCAE